MALCLCYCRLLWRQRQGPSQLTYWRCLRVKVESDVAVAVLDDADGGVVVAARNLDTMKMTIVDGVWERECPRC